MDLVKKIKKHAAKNYNSSPHNYNNIEIGLMIENNCKCCNCGKSIFELDDFPVIRNQNVYCEDCEREDFYSDCAICQESFEKAEKAIDYKLLITKELAQKEEIKAGIYKVLKFPFFRACVVFGFESLYTENLEIIREIDIEKVEREIRLLTWAKNKQDLKLEIESGEICECCFEKYTLKKRHFTHWSNDAKRIHWNINERGAIMTG